ncbi:MAG: hypothetical protein JOY99_01260 [Sphingomonadaceae bacterium]|nr:hypothetical protein [Sphingomonadaceae bacterium]
MRRVAPLLPLLLAGCHARHRDPVAGTPIPCAIGQGALFAKRCRVQKLGTQLLLVRPDGGFRRIDTAGGINAADGAEPIAVARSGDSVDVAIAGERYRLPAALVAPR